MYSAVIESVFLYCCTDCPSCPASALSNGPDSFGNLWLYFFIAAQIAQVAQPVLIQMVQATLAICAALKRYSLKINVTLCAISL